MRYSGLPFKGYTYSVIIHSFLHGRLYSVIVPGLFSSCVCFFWGGVYKLFSDGVLTAPPFLLCFVMSRLAANFGISNTPTQFSSLKLEREGEWLRGIRLVSLRNYYWALTSVTTGDVYVTVDKPAQGVTS